MTKSGKGWIGGNSKEKAKRFIAIDLDNEYKDFLRLSMVDMISMDDNVAFGKIITITDFTVSYSCLSRYLPYYPVPIQSYFPPQE